MNKSEPSLQVVCMHCDEWAEDFCAGCGRAICPNHAFEEASRLGPQWVCQDCSSETDNSTHVGSMGNGL